MRIENRTRNTVLGSRVVLAATWWSRLRGFLGSHDPVPGEGILLMPCNGVHTYGMSFSIDVLFLDASGEVLKMVGSLRPWKRTGRVKGSHYVLEVPTGVIESSGTCEGDRLTWWDPAPVPPADRITHGQRRRPHKISSARGNQ